MWAEQSFALVTSVIIGKIQRRLAWPSRRDHTHKLRDGSKNLLDETAWQLGATYMQHQRLTAIQHPAYNKWRCVHFQDKECIQNTTAVQHFSGTTSYVLTIHCSSTSYTCMQLAFMKSCVIQTRACAMFLNMSWLFTHYKQASLKPSDKASMCMNM